MHSVAIMIITAAVFQLVCLIHFEEEIYSISILDDRLCLPQSYHLLFVLPP